MRVAACMATAQPKPRQRRATPSKPQSGTRKRTPCRTVWERSTRCHTRRAPAPFWNASARHTSFHPSRRCNPCRALKGMAAAAAFEDLLTHFNSGGMARPSCHQQHARNENFHLQHIECRPRVFRGGGGLGDFVGLKVIAWANDRDTLPDFSACRARIVIFFGIRKYLRNYNHFGGDARPRRDSV